MQESEYEKTSPNGGQAAPSSSGDRVVAVDTEAVAKRAYELWQERGCPCGSPDDDWFRAEHEVRSSTTESAASES